MFFLYKKINRKISIIVLLSMIFLNACKSESVGIVVDSKNDMLIKGVATNSISSAKMKQILADENIKLNGDKYYALEADTKNSFDMDDYIASIHEKLNSANRINELSGNKNTLELELNKNVINLDDVFIERKEKIATRSKLDRFYFVGDVIFSKRLQETYDAGGINSIIEPSILKLFKEGDFTIGNLECVITEDNGNGIKDDFNLCMPKEYVKCFKEADIDLFTLANNHALDFGIGGLADTLKVLDENGIKHVGAGGNITEAKAPYLFEIEGNIYAVFSATAVVVTDDWKAGDNHPGVNNGYDITTVCEDIKLIRDYVDNIIVYMHWGKELDVVANSTQRNIAHHLVDSGADLIVGAHSHTVQDIEYYKGVPIFYSLGNFMYGRTMRENIILEVGFDYTSKPKGELWLKVYPGISGYEQARLQWDKNVIAVKCAELDDKCDTCVVNPYGVVYSHDQHLAALKNQNILDFLNGTKEMRDWFVGALSD